MSSKAKAAAVNNVPLVPAESPVPGVDITLASLLVEAIKTRRKFIKSTSCNQDKSLIETISNKATDANTSFLNELRNQVQSFSTSRRKKHVGNAPANCLKFLLEIISNDSNSFHLRRAALVLIREILQRSSDARAYLASGETLLDFVSIVEGIQVTGEERDAAASSNNPNQPTPLTPVQLFQQEAIELIHHLALQYGQLYSKFTVASRLLGDISTQLQLQNQGIGAITSQGRHNNNQRHNIHLIRKKRDEALERGPNACSSLERMIEKADHCFKVLLPRWGGFNVDEHRKTNDTPAPETSIPDDVSIDFDDEDSIEWEDGDDDVQSVHETDGKAHVPENGIDTSSHAGAVAQTLAVMEKSGTLLDGKISVEIRSQQSQNNTQVDGSKEEEGKSDARLELEAIVKKISSKRFQRLNQWCIALKYADGMMERAVIDPTRSWISDDADSGGPVSVVLLPKDKRAARGPLLQQMMKLKGELEHVLQSAEILGVFQPENGGRSNDTVQAPAVAEARVVERKRAWLSGTFTNGHHPTKPKKQKNSKVAKVRVLYRRR